MATKIKKQIEFFRLVAMPKIERVELGYPETLLGISEYLGVMYGTIILWHKKAKQMGISKMDNTGMVAGSLPPMNADEREWGIFMKQLTADAAQKGATAPTRVLYAQLKGKMPKTNINLEVSLSADERARRNIEADKQLEEGGFR